MIHLTSTNNKIMKLYGDHAKQVQYFIDFIKLAYKVSTFLPVFCCL